MAFMSKLEGLKLSSIFFYPKCKRHKLNIADLASYFYKHEPIIKSERWEA